MFQDAGGDEGKLTFEVEGDLEGVEAEEFGGGKEVENEKGTDDGEEFGRKEGYECGTEFEDEESEREQ